MQRILTIVIGIGFLAGLIPVSACVGQDSCRGTKSCCCARPVPAMAAAATEDEAPSAIADPAPERETQLHKGCPCPTEMRRAPSDPAPSTLPGSPTLAAAAATPVAQSPASPGPTAHPTRLTAPLAEPPPLNASVPLHTILRL